MNGLSPVIAATLLFVAAAAGTTLPLPARAAESYENCTGFIDTVPATITSPGTWCLRRDLRTAITSGAAIRIEHHDVTLDCNHFTIDGFVGGTASRTSGIYAEGTSTVSIRNCNIRGFATGIMLGGWYTDSHDHLVERNTLTGNTRHGIYVVAFSSTIRDNRVLDTGGSTVAADPRVRESTSGITAANGVDVIDNVVNGVIPTPSDEADAYGIRTMNNGAGSINGNRISGLAPYNGATAYGIHNANSRGLIIRRNDIRGPGASVVGAVGLRCSSTPATARDNVIAGFATAIQKCMSVGNTVNTF